MILFQQDRAYWVTFLKLSSFRPFVELRQDFPVLLENGEFTVSGYFIYVYASKSQEEKLPVFSLPLLQMGFLLEDKRTSYRYFICSEQKG